MPITPIITTSSDVVRKEVHNVVAAEMSCLREQMKEYVEREWERHAAEMDAVLRTRFAELRSVHEGFSKVLMEMGNSINKLRADTTAAVEGIAQSASAEIAEVQRTLKLHIVESERDIRVWREAIQELQSETKANIRAHTHRLDEALRGFVVSRQDSLQDTESAIKRAVEKIESKVAAVSTRHEAQSTAAEQAIASLRAQSHVVEDTMRQMYSQLHHVTDEQQAQRSEIRRLHSDLSQVDAAMRGRGTALHLSREPAYRAEPQNDGVQQELFALKQSVAYLGAMVDKKHPHSSNDDAVLPLHQDPAGRIGKHSKHNHNRYGALQHSTSAQEQEQAEEDRDDVVVDRARNEDDATGFPGMAEKRRTGWTKKPKDWRMRKKQ